MDGFTFYKSYYETLKKIRKRADRAETAIAVLEFMFDGCEPENLSEGGEIAFESFRRTLEISRVRGKSGETQKQIKVKSKENQNEIKNETNEIKSETRLSSSLRLSLINPPLSPLTQGEGDAKTAFFEKYPALKGKRVKDEGIDYTVLLSEFEKSTKLRGMYSFAKVVQMYDAIVRGDMRDKDTVLPGIAAANARSARDKWYADKRAKAEAAADRYRAIVNGSERFKQIERALGNLNLEMAKAELYEPHRLPGLQEARLDYLEERQELLAHLGVQEWQLEPQYDCEKCNDSGYQADGRACDCYKEVAV